MSNDPLNNPLNELGHISLTARQLSQSTAQLAASASQVGRDLQHGIEVFAPIVAELTGELKRLRLEIHEGAEASSRSAWSLVFVTIALVIATVGMAWPIWFPKAPAPAATPSAVPSPAQKLN